MWYGKYLSRQNQGEDYNDYKSLQKYFHKLQFTLPANSTDHGCFRTGNIWSLLSMEAWESNTFHSILTMDHEKCKIPLCIYFLVWTLKHTFNKFCRTVKSGNNVFTWLIMPTVSSIWKNVWYLIIQLNLLSLHVVCENTVTCKNRLAIQSKSDSSGWLDIRYSPYIYYFFWIPSFKNTIWNPAL